MIFRKRVPLAWLNLTHNKRRFVISLAGITFAVLLMFMELGFWNAMLDSVAALIERFNAELVITSKAKYTLSVREPFSRRRLEQAAGVAGVKEAWPLYLEYRFSLWKDLDRQDPEGPSTRTIRVIAYDPDKPVLRLPEVARHAEQLRLPDTVLMDEKSRSYFGSHQPGIIRELAQRRVQVVGTFRLGTDFIANGNLIMSAENYARFFPHRTAPAVTLDQVEIGLVQLEPGAHPAQVQQALRGILPDDVAVWTRGEFAQQEKRFWQRSTPIGFVFTMGLVLGFGVGVVICYQILSADVAAHLAEYATLKAIGFSDGFLTWTVLNEALWLALVGFVPGLFFSAGLYRVLANWTGLPLHLTLARGAVILLLTIGMCMLSGILALRKVRSMDPAEVYA